MESQSRNLFSSISTILWCMYYSFIITLQDIHPCFSRVFQMLSFLLFYSVSFDSHESHHVEGNVSTSEVTPMITGQDIELVMEHLGLSSCDQEPLQVLVNITNIFDVNEPSLEEIREAFNLFDENHDGFVDAGELKRVVDLVSARTYTKQECDRMIAAYDETGDGRICFREFVKLMEKCFS